jgi:hypothetical protein
MARLTPFASRSNLGEAAMSRRQRLAAVLALIGCLTLAGILAAPLLAPPSRIDRARFDELVAAMPRAEVERLLGGPPRDECRGDVDVWVRRNGKVVSAELPAGPPTLRFFPDAAPDMHEMVWVGESGLIAVLIDADGRVRDKHFSTVHVLERFTLASAVARWIGR